MSNSSFGHMLKVTADAILIVVRLSILFGRIYHCRKETQRPIDWDELVGRIHKSRLGDISSISYCQLIDR